MGVKSSALNSAAMKTVLETPPQQVTYALGQRSTGKAVKAFYINLDHRTDRKQLMESECDGIGLSVSRFSAVRLVEGESNNLDFRLSGVNNQVRGALGCTLSHVGCLKQGLQSEADHILVMEDDFYFTQPPHIVHELLASVKETAYDVFMLGYCVMDKTLHISPTSHPLFDKIQDAYCSHGYVVYRGYAPKLIQNLEESANKLRLTGDGPKYALDQHWKRLQAQDMWLCYKEGPCGLQSAGYSDVELKHKSGSVTNIASGE